MKAALYLRVSTEDQAREGLSLPAQREALLAFCRSQGWTVADVYVDDGYSGKDLSRPAMSRLLADIAAGKLNLVLVYKLDRLSRRQKDVLHLLEDVFEPAGVAFRSATEPFDTATPFGKAMLGMLSVFAQLERETIVERARMGKRQRAREGDWTGGGHPTFGYDYRPGASRALIVKPEQAETVRQIFSLYADQLMGYEAIARELNRRAIATPRGAKLWAATTVRRILCNPIYTGKMLYDYRGKRDLYPGNHEAIIPEELFERVRQEMVERRDRQSAPKRRSLLSGLLVCAECGGKMRAKTQWVNWPRTPKKYHHNYACYNYLGEPSHLVTQKCTAGYHHGPELEGRVLERLSEYAFDADLVDEVAAEALAATDEELRQADARKMRLQSQLADVSRRVSRWSTAFEDGALTASDFAERVRELHARREAIEQEMARLAEVSERREEIACRVADLRRQLADLPAALDTLTRDELWAVLHHLIRKIRVDGSGAIVEMRFW